jgi:hypothetical protein
VALFDNTEIGRGCDEARAQLAQLLGDNHVLVGKFTDLVLQADMMAHEDAWWQEPKVKEIRRAAADLALSLDSLDWLEFQVVEAEFNEPSRRIYTGWTLSADAATDPDVARRMEEYADDPNDADRGFLVRFHAQVRELAELGARGVGRPQEEVRRRVAVRVAEELLLAGIKPARSDSRSFASILRVVFRCANLAPPVDLYRVTAYAMDDISILTKSNPTLAEAVRQAQPQRKSTDSGRKPRIGRPSSRAGRRSRGQSSPRR